MRPWISAMVVAVAAVLGVPATAGGLVAVGDAGAVIDPGDGGRYAPVLDPAGFTATVDHPYWPLPVGARWVFEESSGRDRERIEVTVLPDTKTVMGIPATVVHDVVTVDGQVIEDTYDWYAQDRDGNVWYLGEDSTEYEDGEVVGTEGSWEAGVDGALPGIVMRAAPEVGDAYRQEYYADEAEDMAEVVKRGARVKIPAGTFDDVLVTKEWTPLEPKVVEKKYYAPGVGVVKERGVRGSKARVRLVEYTLGP